MINFTLVIPHLPPSELYTNRLRRLHWAVRSRVQSEARQEAYYEALAVKPSDWTVPEYAEIKYLFLTSDKRIKDVDGLISASKAYLDGIVDAGILQTDNCWHLRIGGAEVRQGVKQTVLTITGVDKWW